MRARSGAVPAATVRRLTEYLRVVQLLLQGGKQTVTSVELAKVVGVDASVVRSDLQYVELTGGRRGVGYAAGVLADRIEAVLGTDREQAVILIGVGNLGRAIANYPGLTRRKFRIVGLFDSDRAKTGQQIGNLRIQWTGQVAQVVERTGARLAILAVPSETAQDVASALCLAGIVGILSFAPLRPLENCRVVVVDLASELERLSFSAGLGSIKDGRARGKIRS